MCEEVREPATQVPKAMVYTIILNTGAGLLFMIPLLFVLPDIDGLLALSSGQPVPSIIKSAVGSAGGAFGLLVPLLVLAIICGIGCTTASSRCIWAFARDGAVPGSHLWKRIDARLGIPFNAMMLSMVVQIALGLIYFGSSAAFNAFSGVGVICLTTSYAMPIAVSLLDRRQAIKDASFHLGSLGVFCNIVAIGASSPSILLRVCGCVPLADLRIPDSLVFARHSSLLHAFRLAGLGRNHELYVQTSVFEAPAVQRVSWEPC